MHNHRMRTRNALSFFVFSHRSPFTGYLLSWHLVILQRDSSPISLVRQTPALVNSLMKRLLLSILLISSLALGAPPEKATIPEEAPATPPDKETLALQALALEITETKGEWLVLSANTFGRIIEQTPEYGKIIHLGGARKSIPTGSFFEMNPNNLSKNFRINSIFGISSEVFADFSAEVAPKYSQLHRTIQRVCVNFCNKQDWIIPFTQITVHQATPEQS